MSLAATYLQDIRAQYPSNLDRDELRVTQTGLLQAVIKMTDSPNSIVSDDLKKKAKDSQGRTLAVPVMKKGNVTIKNARSCSIECAQSDSGLVEVVWQTVVIDVCMVPGQYEKNEIGYTTDLAKKIREGVEKMKVLIEQNIDTALDTHKNQVYNSALATSKYGLTGNAIQVTGEDKQKLFFNDLEPINYEDDFYDPTLFVIASPALMSNVNEYINQGAGNDKNLSFQFAGKNFLFSNRVTNASGKLATGYFMPDGSVGFLTRIDVDARMNAKATDGTEWFEDYLPGMPFSVGVQYKSKCDDKSALESNGLAHLTATKVELYQFSFDFALITPYSSDPATKPTAIRKFEFVPAS